MRTNEVLLPIEPIGQLDHLRIYTSYYKGGFNALNGQTEDRGVFVFVVPVGYKNGIFSQEIFGDTLHAGFKVLAKPLGRRSPKSEDKVWGAIKDRTEEIADLFRASKFNGILGIIRSATQSI